ncbi:hypothetical protein F5Y16DRAFT_392111 [Xylariaceae sp. FL0255]|nr:hypothetical protein F5Y16DRAFT_392111 [Xylariaceae sp. FL0255]
MSRSPSRVEEWKARTDRTTGVTDEWREYLEHALGDNFNTESVVSTPSLEGHFVPRGNWNRGVNGSSRKVMIVDRILEWQTIAKFLSIAMGSMRLPTGKTISQPITRDECFLMTKPYSEWAPPPFNNEDTVAIDRMTTYIGSFEDPYRTQIISKELQAMKCRLWEGIMPLSARRWQEQKLYDLENFSKACHVLSMVINVFHYLNVDVVRDALKETFLRIDRALGTFEDALNAKIALEGGASVEISRKWHEFVYAKYEVMVNTSHIWVTNHLEHMKDVVMAQIELQETFRDRVDGRLVDMELTKLFGMWQNLMQISHTANYSILMSTDGYAGPRMKQEDFKDETHMQTLPVALDIHRRIVQYHERRGRLTQDLRVNEYVGAVSNPRTPDYESIATELRAHDSIERILRNELHREPIEYEAEPWVTAIRDKEDWGFVVFRTCHSCTDDEWDKFRAKFDADQSDWGAELSGVEALRKRSKLHWLDAKDFGIEDGDVEALKSSFEEFIETEEFPENFFRDIFLVADAACVASYLTSASEDEPPLSGDTGSFVCAVEASFDPEEGASRPMESPGYGGTLRVLGSLLWDDFSAQLASYCSSLESLWPLAMSHPFQIYVGPGVKVHNILPRRRESVASV